MLYFTKIKLVSKYVNWIASSCFGIYLLHSNSFLATPYYDSIIFNWFKTLNRFEFIIYTTLFILIVFVIAILFDKIRIYIYTIIRNKINIL